MASQQAASATPPPPPTSSAGVPLASPPASPASSSFGQQPAASLARVEEPRALLTYRDDFRLWPHIESHLLPRLPLRSLTWKSLRGTRTIPQLDVAIKPFDPALLPKTSLFPSLTPALHMYFVHCDDLETYRQVIRSEIKDWVANFTGANAKRTADQDWCIVVINTDAHPGAAGDGASGGPGSSGGSGSGGGGAAQGMAKLASQTQKFLSMKTSVLDKIKSDFGATPPLSVPSVTLPAASSDSGPASTANGSHASSLPARRLDRIISLRLHAGDFTKSHEGWSDFFTRIKDGLLASFETQVARYDDDIQRLDAQRMMPGWNYCQFFLLKEGLANCFAATNLGDDALMQLDELEAAWEQTVHRQVVGFSEFFPSVASLGPNTTADDLAGLDHVGPMMLQGIAPQRDYRSLLLNNTISIYDFRVYLAARQFAQLARQRRPVALATRVLRWLRAFVPVVHQHRAPAWFAEALTLSVCESTLAAIDAMIPALKLDSEQMARVQGAKLDVVLVAKGALDRVGAHVHGLQPSLGTPTASDMPAAAQDDLPPPFQLATPTLVSSLTSLDAYAQVYTSILDQGDLCAQLAQRPRFAMLLQTDRANLAYAQGDWARAGDLYAKVVTSYAEAGWLAVDRCLLQRQAQCYRAVGARQEYLMTCLRLVASNIVNNGGGSPTPGMTRAAATGADDWIDWAQLTGVARELHEPVVVEFAPLFQVRLPPNVFTVVQVSSATPAPRVALDPDAMVLVSHLALPLAVDRISLTLVGGETNDLVFSTSDVTLLPGPQGTRLTSMVWDSPGTAGEYVAEKVKIEVGRLVFVTNLLKENRKHTLRIFEPPAPVVLDLGLPVVVAPGNRDVMVKLTVQAAHRVAPGGVLTLWSLHPHPKPLTPECVELVHPTSGSVVCGLERVGTDSAVGVDHPGQYQVPEIPAGQSVCVRLTLPEPWAEVTIKAVFEATLPHTTDAEGGVPLTVSLVDSVVNASVPLVEAEIQAIGGAHEYLVLTVTNTNVSGVLSVDACTVQVDPSILGEATVVALNPDPLMLPVGQTGSLAYLVQGMDATNVLAGTISLRHHYFDEDVRRYLFSKLRQVLDDKNLVLYYPLLKQAWALHIAEMDWTALALTGVMTIPDPGPLALGILPPSVLDLLQAAAAEFFAQVKSIKLGQIPPSHPSDHQRLTHIPLSLELPVAHLQYGISPVPPSSPSALPESRQAPLVVVGMPWSCQVVVKRLPTRRERVVEPRLEIVYEVLASEDTWLVAGGRRRVFTLAPDSHASYPISLIPLVSGHLALPPVQLGVRLASPPSGSSEPSALMVSVEPLVGGAFPRAIQVCPEPTTTLVVVDGTHVQRVGQPSERPLGSITALNPTYPPSSGVPLPPVQAGVFGSSTSLVTSSLAAGVGSAAAMPARSGSRSSLSGAGAGAALAAAGAGVSRSVLGLHRNSDFSLNSSTGTPA